jgi:hypothetical protein
MPIESALASQLHLRALVSALLDEFSHRTNSGASIASLLHPDAALETPRGVIQGREAIVELFRSLSETRQAAGRKSRHFNTNLVVTTLPDGTIEARSLLVALAIEGGQDSKASQLLGDQVDIIAQSENGSVCFKSRKMVPGLMFAMTPERRP